MLIKPDLKDEKIIACLRDAYGLDIATISFLRLGADFNTAVCRIVTRNQMNYFLKLRSGEFLEASPVAVKMALFLKSKSNEMLKLVERAEKLAVTIQKQPFEYILCHANIHGWNLLTDKEGAL